MLILKYLLLSLFAIYLEVTKLYRVGQKNATLLLS